MKYLLLIVGLTLSFFVHGCGETDNNEDALNTEIVEGCKHMKYGNSVALDTREMAQSAPSIHPRYDVSLAATSNTGENNQSDATYTGTINFDSMGGTHVLFLSHVSSVQIMNSAQETISPTRTDTMNQSCEEAAIVIVVDLPEGSYSFTIADAPHDTLELAIHAFDADLSHAEHGHEDHEDHEGH